MSISTVLGLARIMRRTCRVGQGNGARGGPARAGLTFRRGLHSVFRVIAVSAGPHGLSHACPTLRRHMRSSPEGGGGGTPTRIKIMLAYIPN